MPLTKKKNKYLLIFGIWMGFGLIYGFQTYLFNEFEGYNCNVFATVADQMPTFILWGFYTLLIFWIIKKFPPDQTNKLLLFFGIHLVTVIIISFFHVTVLAYFRWLYYSYTGRLNESFTSYLLRYSIAWLLLQYLLYIAVVITGYAIDFYRKYRDKESQNLELEKLLSEAKLNALKMQLHPHFLFNTLNTISMLIRKNDDQQAIKTIAGLSDLLRYVLETRDTQWTYLKKELELIEKYLSIISLRFPKKINYEIEISSEAENIYIPDLILQPIVENSVKHGLSEKKENGKISIYANKKGEKLEIIVKDNGIGFDSSNYGVSSFGIGIKNTGERLKKIYDNKAVFEIDSKKDEGTVVRFVLPVKVA